MSDQKLLLSFETLEYDPQLIKETREKNGGKMILKGVIQRADVLNQNGRIYPKVLLDREIRNFQKFIVENRALGECDHPDESVVSIKNVSHIMRDVSMDDKGIVHGSLEVLDTPCGKIVQSLVESGVRLGISSRGVGSTKKQGEYQVVQDDFQLITFDIVSEPSTPGAFLFTEGKKVSTEEMNKIFTKSDRISRIVNEILFKK